MRVCAIDVGTNTVNTLVADVEDGRLHVVADAERFARLGEGVDAERRISEAAMNRVLLRLAQAKDDAEQHGAERVVIGATSASRDARNIGDLRTRVRRDLNLEYQVIAGEAEARLSFRGALAMLPPAILPDAADAVVVDIGGGSTEIAAGRRGRPPRLHRSLDVGSVRLTERHLRTLPAVGRDVEAACAAVREALASLPLEDLSGLPVVSTGSTARVVAGLATGARPPVEVGVGRVTALRERLAQLSEKETLALDADLLKGREDISCAAVIVLETVLVTLGAASYRATPGGLRHGLALAAAGVVDKMN